MKQSIMLFMSALLTTGRAQAADLSKVPQMSETKEQRDERMQWFRDAKFGMFIHWGSCSINPHFPVLRVRPPALSMAFTGKAIS